MLELHTELTLVSALHPSGCQGSVSLQGQPTGPWLIPSCSHCTDNTEGSGLGHTTAVGPGPPQHPRPLNTPRRFEHNSSWVLTFSTSSFQSCRGHRATGKEISVGDVVKHSALTPTGKDAPWTQQANSRDKPALHPAAAARSMPLPLIPAPSSSVSQRESESLPPAPAACQLCSLPGLLQPLHSTGSRKKGINSRVPCTARLTWLKLQRLKDSPSFRIVERQVSFRAQATQRPVFLTHGPEKWDNPPSLHCQQANLATARRKQGLDAASEPGKTSHDSFLFSFLLSSSTGAHLRQQSTGHLQLLVGSGFRTRNNEQESHRAMAKGERRQKNTLIFPRGPWLGSSTAAKYCLSPDTVKSPWIWEHSSLSATPTPVARGMTPVELSFTTQSHLCRTGKVTRHS